VGRRGSEVNSRFRLKAHLIESGEEQANLIAMSETLHKKKGMMKIMCTVTVEASGGRPCRLFVEVCFYLEVSDGCRLPTVRWCLR